MYVPGAAGIIEQVRVGIVRGESQHTRLCTAIGHASCDFVGKFPPTESELMMKGKPVALMLNE